MNIFYYDKTFEGILSAVFDSFKMKLVPDKLIGQGDIEPLFVNETHQVETIASKVNRVQLGLKKRVSEVALNQIMYVWLSELQGCDQLIFNYLIQIFKSSSSIETDYSNPDVLMIRKVAQKVQKERHQLMEFVRFNLIQTPEESGHQQIYFAAVSPVYNSLPLVIHFFKRRFADQKWAIYDEKREYGFYYDLKKFEQITLDSADHLISGGRINASYLAGDEALFQTMWYKYCQSLTIKERVNPTLQRQHMPTRFWKYLPEMNRTQKN